MAAVTAATTTAVTAAARAAALVTTAAAAVLATRQRRQQLQQHNNQHDNNTTTTTTTNVSAVVVVPSERRPRRGTNDGSTSRGKGEGRRIGENRRPWARHGGSYLAAAGSKSGKTSQKKHKLIDIGSDNYGDNSRYIVLFLIEGTLKGN